MSLAYMGAPSQKHRVFSAPCAQMFFSHFGLMPGLQGPHHDPHLRASSSLTGGTLRPKSVFFTQTLGTCTARRHQPEGPPITGTAAGYVFSCVRKF